MLRKLSWLLILELIVAANAGASFHFLDRYTAGLWAGACFVSVGILILWRFFKWNFQSRSPLFWVAVAHTFVFAIPLFVARLTTPPDERIQSVLYFPVDLFHHFSTATYLLLMVATLLEMGLQIRRMRKKTPKI